MKNFTLSLLLFSLLIGACTKDDCDHLTTKDIDTVIVTLIDTIIVTDTVIIPPEYFLTPYDTSYGLGAGFRYSVYGPDYDPGPNYWDSTGNVIASNFDDTAPECIWIVGVIVNSGCNLNFPVEGNYDLINGSSRDYNEEIFDLFDESGYRVWLQVEPGNAPVDTLIKIVMSRYAHHPCITGFGVDVEWLETNTPIGRQVKDNEAKKWLFNIKSHNPKYRLFLKHWEVEKMPPTYRDDIVFIDDSQMFNNLGQMVSEFKYWGNYFKPADVGFQYGYSADETWWGEFDNPMKYIGDSIVNEISNAKSLFWVDFTIIDQYPPAE
jgi:hypothetical protein